MHKYLGLLMVAATVPLAACKGEPTHAAESGKTNAPPQALSPKSTAAPPADSPEQSNHSALQAVAAAKPTDPLGFMAFYCDENGLSAKACMQNVIDRSLGPLRNDEVGRDLLRAKDDALARAVRNYYSWKGETNEVRRAADESAVWADLKTAIRERSHAVKRERFKLSVDIELGKYDPEKGAFPLSRVIAVGQTPTMHIRIDDSESTSGALLSGLPIEYQRAEEFLKTIYRRKIQVSVVYTLVRTRADYVKECASHGFIEVKKVRREDGKSINVISHFSCPFITGTALHAVYYRTSEWGKATSILATRSAGETQPVGKASDGSRLLGAPSVSAPGNYTSMWEFIFGKMRWPSNASQDARSLFGSSWAQVDGVANWTFILGCRGVERSLSPPIDEANLFRWPFGRSPRVPQDEFGRARFIDSLAANFMGLRDAKTLVAWAHYSVGKYDVRSRSFSNVRWDKEIYGPNEWATIEPILKSGRMWGEDSGPSSQSAIAMIANASDKALFPPTLSMPPMEAEALVDGLGATWGGTWRLDREGPRSGSAFVVFEVPRIRPGDRVCQIPNYETFGWPKVRVRAVALVDRHGNVLKAWSK